jgi:hypothetical protein
MRLVGRGVDAGHAGRRRVFMAIMIAGGLMAQGSVVLLRGRRRSVREEARQCGWARLS